MARRIALAFVLSLSLSGPAAAQGFGGFIKDKLKQEAKEKTSRAVDEATDSTYQGAKDKAKGKGAGEEKASAARERGAEDGDASEKQGGEAAVAKDEVAAGDVYGNKFDFIPGDKVLLFDDFAETDVGDYPARWTVKEGGGGNAVEVVSYKGKKWFKATASENGINQSSTHFLRYDPKGDLPKKFTIEFDADMGAPFTIIFNKQRGWGGQEISYDPRDGMESAQAKAPMAPLGKVVKRVSISVNGTYAKVYVGGTRVLQDPDAVERPITRLGFRFDNLHGRKNSSEDPDALNHQMFTNFRLAEGGKDVAKALDTEGRIVVHGIYFDTGSDVIRPESGGALRNVLAVLQDGSARFRIEGHTDDQGGAAVNGPLSERRAAAVKAWFEAQGVDAKRLEAKGFGATKPMDTNATQEGRANNRRVEFVRL
jgi:outer membrane protein OmpA-like peptidoglycan-associated protein